MGLDLYEIFLEVEEAFDVHFKDVDLGSVVTVGGLFDVTLSALREQHPERFTADSEYAEKAWEQLKSLIAFQRGVRKEQVTVSAHFVSDLGCT